MTNKQLEKEREMKEYWGMSDLRERLGRRVREVWVQWAKEQPNPKASWLISYDDLREEEKEADQRIGMALWGDFVTEYAEAIADYNVKLMRRNHESKSISNT